jgi:gliding motility associated protien GldN
MNQNERSQFCANAAQQIKPKSIVLIFVFVLTAITAFGQPDPVMSPPAFGETFYLKENVRTRKATPYLYEREADMMWSKRVWRTIDLREKFNLPMYYPETELNERKSLFDVIKKGLIEGRLTAFGNPAFSDDFSVRMTKREVGDMLTWYDSTAITENPNDQGSFISAPIRYDLTSKDIKQYWIKEDWFFDKQRSVMDVRILGICPLKEKADPTTGEILGYSPLFWIYFPELRPLLANAEVFNVKNDAARMSYDDLFMKRMFQSYVRKESNVYDRVIVNYATGLDALLEADRVKEDIAKMEHDVWHF